MRYNIRKTLHQGQYSPSLVVWQYQIFFDIFFKYVIEDQGEEMSNYSKDSTHHHQA